MAHNMNFFAFVQSKFSAKHDMTLLTLCIFGTVPQILPRLSQQYKETLNQKVWGKEIEVLLVTFNFLINNSKLNFHEFSRDYAQILSY